MTASAVIREACQMLLDHCLGNTPGQDAAHCAYCRVAIALVALPVSDDSPGDTA